MPHPETVYRASTPTTPADFSAKISSTEITDQQQRERLIRQTCISQYGVLDVNETLTGKKSPDWPPFTVNSRLPVLFVESTNGYRERSVPLSLTEMTGSTTEREKCAIINRNDRKLQSRSQRSSLRWASKRCSPSQSPTTGLEPADL